VAGGIRIQENLAMADPEGYRITIYEKDQPRFWPPKTN
jgi:hypothetical protein